VWELNDGENLPAQCSLGCCLIGDQAAFVTQVRCKKLSSFYGLETNFRTDIQDETSCIAQAQATDKGACVFEREFERTCQFTTRGECNQLSVGGETGITNVTTDVTFHENFLCSAEDLGTNCGPSENTICLETKDEVYFVDTCGNTANIYDASKINEKSYWRMIIPKEESCGFGNSDANGNDASCGNCDYFSGSICKSCILSYLCCIRIIFEKKSGRKSNINLRYIIIWTISSI